MTRPVAVMVCGQVPAQNAPQAGQKTAFLYLTELAATHVVELLVVCKAEDETHDPKVLQALQRYTRSCRFVSLSTAARLWGLARGFSRDVAPLFASRCIGRVESALSDLIASARPELVWLEFSQVFWLVERVPTGIRSVLSAHDVYTQLIASRTGFQQTFLLGMTFRCEKRFLDRADGVRVQSKKDAALLESFFRIPARKIQVAPPALSGFLATLRRTAESVEPRSILFWGAMARAENAEAAVGFVQNDLPALLQRHPRAKLYIVGSNPTAEVKNLAGPSVKVTGFIDDPSAYFERCSIGIAPLASGAGVKVKVLEMIRAGMQVVSTPVGAEGIEDNALLVVAERSGFVDAIDRLWQ